MPSNDKKIDNNCIISFKRAKKDVYALMDEQKRQAEIIRELRAARPQVQQVSLDKDEFREELIKVYESIKSNYDRITEVWEYAESIKASTTRLSTSVKKLQKEQEKISRLAKNTSSETKRKIISLNKKISEKTAQLVVLKAEQKKILSLMKKTVKTASKSTTKKVSSKTSKFGSLQPNLELVEGIGPKYADKLKEKDIKTTKQLLVLGSTPAGRQDIAKRVRVNKKRVLEWVNRVDLMRISGVGEEYSDLLEEAGVDTIPELAQRNPENLAEMMAEINDKKNLVRALPSDSQVKEWVSQAKKLPRLVQY